VTKKRRGFGRLNPSQAYTSAITNGQVVTIILPTNGLTSTDFRLVRKYLDLIEDAALYEDEGSNLDIETRPELPGIED
jgi:hypothetical protein